MCLLKAGLRAHQDSRLTIVIHSPSAASVVAGKVLLAVVFDSKVAAVVVAVAKPVIVSIVVVVVVVVVVAAAAAAAAVHLNTAAAFSPSVLSSHGNSDTAAASVTHQMFSPDPNACQREIRKNPS